MQGARTFVAKVAATRVGDLAGLIRAEYDEIFGICLARAQAKRLWRLDPAVCDTALRAMADAGFLRLTPGGYVRG